MSIHAPAVLRNTYLKSDVKPPRPYTHEEQMGIAKGYELYIPQCIDDPPHPLHFPDLDRPLRINIQGPLLSIQKLLPKVLWKPDYSDPFPQPGGPELASLTYKKIYGRDLNAQSQGELVVRDEYLGWIPESREIDYYGVTFDHLVSKDDKDPETLQINIIEIENDGGAYARQWLRIAIDPDDLKGRRILAVPRCCQIRKGSTDRRRINGLVRERDEKDAGVDFPITGTYLGQP